MNINFELEQKIMECWRVVDDLETLNVAVLDKNISIDEISNIIVGLKHLYNLKFDDTFKLYEQSIKEKCKNEVYHVQV